MRPQSRNPVEGHPRTSVCHHCENLIKQRAFVKRIQRCNEKEPRTVNKNDKSLSTESNRFLCGEKRVKKLSSYRKQSLTQRLRIYNLSKTIARLRA